MAELQGTLCVRINEKRRAQEKDRSNEQSYNREGFHCHSLQKVK